MTVAPPPFLEFLNAGLEKGAFETDDALGAILGLMRQTLAWHEQGLVAPLDGLGAIRTNDEGRLFLVEEMAKPAQRNLARVDTVQQPASAAIEILGEARHVMEVGQGALKVSSMDIGRQGETISKPVFLLGYRTWEHAIEHHDEVTDVFSLGMLLASLACGLDLGDPDDLELFVSHRSNLFVLNQRLHPVIASVIVQMTELNRHRRAQDLRSLIGRLENYRDQPAELDLNRIPRFKESGVNGRRKLVQSHLRDRLFDMSRRNRLIYFRPTLQTLNLTVASVPLVLDYRNIRPDQLFTWQGSVAAEISAGGPMSLGKYLRFEDAPYISGVLDKIISEARRDKAEYGFAQLRLVLAFLRWHNLKEARHERIHSPLLLLPVELTKKRGVRDQYILDPTTSEAEVNPALRHCLKHLYNLDLPETVDLREATLESFHTQLQALIQASEPAVTLHKVDKPQIKLIHERARQRLDQFQRRIKQRGQKRREKRPIDYSYDRENFRPMGLQLFLSHIKPARAPMSAATGAAPRARLPHIVAAESGSDGSPSGGSKVLEAERHMFALRDGEQETGGNPYSWDFDLCAMTLGNFNYRKMTLVRDYSNLIETDIGSEAFDQIFSVEPRQVEETSVAPLPMTDQHVVIPCDATQASAIARARTGRSYIIQGPPGTGKSQTITNLIADYVAQGKRVLFVCEKRAAIDVVFHRLHQQGLDELCCLIHDSQADKKAFIQNLKQTAEQWLANPERDKDSLAQREAACRQMEQELAALEQFSTGMSAMRDGIGLPARALLERLIELREKLAPLNPEEAEKLPPYEQWLRHGTVAERVSNVLAEVGEGPCLAKHAFRWLNEDIIRADRPLQTLRQRLDRAEALVDEVQQAFEQSGLPPEHWDTIEEMKALLEFATRTRALADRNLLALLDARSAASQELVKKQRDFERKTQGLAKAAARTTHWRTKLPAGETQNALAQARKSSFLSMLTPGWWRLRRVLNERYDFEAHAVKPGWTQILEELAAEWQAVEVLEAARDEARREYGVDDLNMFSKDTAALQSPSDTTPPAVEALRQLLLKSAEGPALVGRLSAIAPRFEVLLQELEKLLTDYQQHGFPELAEIIRDLREAADVLPELAPPLLELAECPEHFKAALRHFPLEVRQIEAVIANKGLIDLYRQERLLDRFDGRILARRLERLEQAHHSWLGCNAAAIRARVRRTFIEHVNVSSLPAAQLTPEQKVFKKNYSAGRRELEHEFGKTMRYKSIRELAGGSTGQVVRDLKPVWLMSPLSVSDTLPLESALFDVVIFDEASQIPLEEAVPALYRAHQVIVVGDEMQLPPTNFFSSGRSEEEEGVVAEEEGERIEVALDADSFLTQSARNLPATLLAWHYRSRYEALISYSNAAFYSGNLFTIPDRQLPPPELAELRVSDPAQGGAEVDSLLARSVSFHFIENSVYENRRNASEAAYIAQLVRGLLQRDTKLSIGIVAFSEAQQTEIEEALERFGHEDAAFHERLEAEMEREENEQFCGLFVKNLENVQGDERDIIILSICYGYDAGRRMLMNFGPINQRGGEKRLNVIFSRARHHMAVVSSIRDQDITNDYNDGAKALKNFLTFAENISKGDLRGSRRILENLNPLARKALTPASAQSVVANQLGGALRKRGYLVDNRVGQSRFRCDLAVRTKEDAFYQLGILLDSDAHYANPNLVERYFTQPSILRAFGWRVIIVLAKDWFHEPEAVLERIERILCNQGQADEVDDAELDRVPIETARGSAAAPGATPPGMSGALPGAERSISATAEQNKPAVKPAAPLGTQRFEYIGGGSRKFWEITLSGIQVSVRYGRIGTAGQEQTRTFADADRARREADKLIGEKLRKGYTEAG